MSTALVTGASRGIGKAIAVHPARAGCDVNIEAQEVCRNLDLLPGWPRQPERGH